MAPAPHGNHSAMKSDTTPEAAALQLQAVRRLSGPARLDLAVDMSATARALFQARLRAAHPDWPDRMVHLHILRHTLPEGTLPPSLR